MTEQLLNNIDIFSDMSEDEISKIMNMPDVKIIELPSKSEYVALDGIYLILSGKIRVCKKEDGKEIFLKYLMPGDSFGYTGLFMKCQGGGPKLLYAKTRTKTVYIPEKTLVELVSESPRFAVNIIALLTEKIRFLNKKIDSFTSPTTEARLLKYLQSCRTEEDGRVIIYDNMAELARKLDMGRASLYRSFDSLEANGEIRRENGSIYILRK